MGCEIIKGVVGFSRRIKQGNDTFCFGFIGDGSPHFHMDDGKGGQNESDGIPLLSCFSDRGDFQGSSGGPPRQGYRRVITGSDPGCRESGDVLTYTEQGYRRIPPARTG